MLTATGITSLQMTSASGNTESSRATDIINAQFTKTVANNSLVIVISTNNASSLHTQQFIDKLAADIKSNPEITGVKNVTSVYSILVPALNQTNQGLYTAYDNANLTYALLYGVPDVYLNVWSTAYNQTENTILVPAIDQTNQGVYAVSENANMTYYLLYGVPATYLNVWAQVYQQTSNITLSNLQAYSQTATIMQQANPTDYTQYTQPLLYAFNATWCTSFQNPATASWTPIQRAQAASNQTNQIYINTALAGNSTAQAFANALVGNLTLNDFLTNTAAQNNAAIQNFAIQYTAKSGNASTEFVTAAYNLGQKPSSTALSDLAVNIIWNPNTYQMGQNFISTFNNVSYTQTAKILKQADESSFNQYTSHLLDLFNASWCQTFQSQDTQAWTATHRATEASSVANPQFVKAYMGNNTDFVTGVGNAVSLQDFIDANSTKTNTILHTFSLNYVCNQTCLSSQLLTSIFSLGKNASAQSLQTLASNIVQNPDAYKVGDQFNTLITSFVSPQKT